MSEVVNSVFDPGLFALCFFWLGVLRTELNGL